MVRVSRWKNRTQTKKIEDLDMCAGIRDLHNTNFIPRVRPQLSRLSASLLWRGCESTHDRRNSSKISTRREASRRRDTSGTLRTSDCHITRSLEGYPQRVLEFSTSIRLSAHNAWLRAGRTVLNLHSVSQR